MNLEITFDVKDVKYETMAKDVLTVRQLEEQLARRKKKLEYLKETGAPEKAIHTAEADLRLTRRRLERIRNADCDEIIQDLHGVAPDF